METMSFSYAARGAAKGRAVVGVVASGDLQVLLEPAAERTEIHITTSVDGKAAVWSALLERVFAAADLPAARLDIDDCGATPGVVRLRIEQAFEEADSGVAFIKDKR